MVTHDLKTVRRVADRVVMLYPLASLGPDEPQIIFDGPLAELRRRRGSTRAAVCERRRKCRVVGFDEKSMIRYFDQE